MHPALSKVRDLLKLATSSNENEARNAAFLAAKLINQHGFIIVGSFFDAIDSTPPPPASQPPPPKPKASKKTRTELRAMAVEKSLRFVEYLKKKALVHKDFPLFSVKALVEKSVSNREILPEDGKMFSYYLKIELWNFTRQGILVSKPGNAGGYRLSEKWEQTETKAKKTRTSKKEVRA